MLTLRTAQGTWIGPVRVPTGASPETIVLATDLAVVLSRMGGPIAVSAGGPGPGILVGTIDEWAADNWGQTGGAAPDYLTNPSGEAVVDTDQGMVRLFGVDIVGAEKAVWWFAGLLGYQLLTPTWEVVPELGIVKIKIARAWSSPIDGVSGLGGSGGLYADGDARLDVWTRRNGLRNRGDAVYNTGATWGGIVDSIPDFAAHPEYGAGEGLGSKLCVLQSVVEDAAYAYARAKALADPRRRVQSLAISDGMRGWDYSCGPAENAMNPARRQADLGRRVQDRLDADPISGRDVRIGIMAYGATCVDPGVVHPRNFVTITDGFFQGSADYDSVLALYLAAGAEDVGPYSYYSLATRTHCLNGKGRACDPALVESDTDRILSADGIRFGVFEADSNWGGATGLGYYVTAKLLAEGTGDFASWRAEFLGAFGGAADAAGAFYDLAQSEAPLSTDLVHRLYQAVRDAFDATADPVVRTFVRDQAIWVRYVELYLRWTVSKDVDDFDLMVGWMWRARRRDLMATRLAFFDGTWQAAWAGLALKYPGAALNAGNVDTVRPASWRADDPIGDAEAIAFVDAGILANPPLPFEPVGFPDDLEYLARPHDPRARGAFVFSRERHRMVLWMREGQTTLTVTTKGGISDQTHGDGYFRVLDRATDEVIAEIPCRVGIEATYSVQLAGGAMYAVEVYDAGGCHYSWVGHSITIPIDIGANIFAADHSWYFMVPAGTTVIGGYSARAGGTRFFDPSGVLRHTTTSTGYFAISIPPPATDQIWFANRCNGVFALMTVPSDVAWHPDDLLVYEGFVPTP